MSYYLFLDDERHPSQVSWVYMPNAIWQVVRSYEEFVEHIDTHGLPLFVAFDHDLAAEHYDVMLQEVRHFTYNDGDLTKTFSYGAEPTGYECAKWLVDYCVDNNCEFPDYAVHSMNPVGKERIRSYIENAKTHLDI